MSSIVVLAAARADRVHSKIEKKSAKTAKRTDDRGTTTPFCRGTVNRWASRWTLERRTHIYVMTKTKAGTMLREYLAWQAQNKLYKLMCYVTDVAEFVM